jgi:hypothetical protein
LRSAVRLDRVIRLSIRQIAIRRLLDGIEMDLASLARLEEGLP